MNIVQLANYTYYIDSFKGRVIKDSSTFNSCCMEASRIIGMQTLYKVFNDKYKELDEVKSCACKVAEIMYRDMLINENIIANNGKEISSEKVGEYSVNYTNNSNNSRTSEDSINKQINKVIQSYLCTTNLLYRGCLYVG